MKSTTGEKIFYAINNVILGLLALTCFLPLLHELSLSLSGNSAIMAGRVSFFPVKFTLDSYKAVFIGTPILSSFTNSVVITVVGTAISMVATILAAYPLSKSYLYARRQFTMLMVFTMLFSGGLIPSYLVIRGLGLIDSYWALWLPGAISTYNMLILRTFFVNIPQELEEAARIDGCREVRLLVQIYLPLSKACLATLTLFYAVGLWNSFQSVLIYINSTSKYNLTVLVNNMIRNQTLLNDEYLQAADLEMLTPQGVQSAGVMVMIVPIMCVYPFLQKYFVKGVMLGSVKG